jgi:heme-degrading monooxygenase HmoA
MSESTEQAEPLTLINVFEIAAEDIDGFLNGWQKRLEMMSAKQGFISAQLFRAVSQDTRFQLVNVAQWATKDDFARATSDEGFRHSQQAGAEAIGASVRANPGLYRAVATTSAASTTP